MALRLIASASKLAGKVALVRVDTNVPLKGKRVLDDRRLCESVPTIRLLERRGAHVILMGHLGRPRGRRVASLSLRPVGWRLGKLLRQPVRVLPLSLGPAAIRRDATRGAVLLENLRFFSGEDANGASFARRLAALGDVYVNEAFSVAHRRAASTVALAKLLPSYAGLHLAQEVGALERVRKASTKPVVAIIGGAKVGDKLPVIASLLPSLTCVVVGGAVANTLLRARGNRVGRSLVEAGALRQARALARRAGRKLVLPIDVIVDRLGTRERETTWRAVGEVRADERVVDLGTRTVQAYARYLKHARTVLWSGTLGIAEEHEWAHATLALGRLAAARARGAAYVVVGGGDTDAFFRAHGLRVDYVSTGGSAMLDFLADRALPGLTALGYRG